MPTLYTYHQLAPNGGKHINSLRLLYWHASEFILCTHNANHMSLRSSRVRGDALTSNIRACRHTVQNK